MDCTAKYGYRGYKKEGPTTDKGRRGELQEDKRASGTDGAAPERPRDDEPAGRPHGVRTRRTTGVARGARRTAWCRRRDGPGRGRPAAGTGDRLGSGERGDSPGAGDQSTLHRHQFGVTHGGRAVTESPAP